MSEKQPPASDAERKAKSRQASAERIGTDEYRAARAAEMAEYRARKRAPELVKVVALVVDELAKATPYEDIALKLARLGVRVSAGQQRSTD